MTQSGDPDSLWWLDLPILFRDVIATEMALECRATDQATVEAALTSPAGHAVLVLLSSTARALHGAADLELSILRCAIFLARWSLEEFVSAFCAELRYYYRIPSVVKRPSSFHRFITPAVDAKLIVFGKSTSTIVYPVVGPLLSYPLSEYLTLVRFSK